MSGATATDVEIWLTGDPASVMHAIQALSVEARITQLGDEHPLFGPTDTGRVRRYVRLAKHIAPRRAKPSAVDQLPDPL